MALVVPLWEKMGMKVLGCYDLSLEFACFSMSLVVAAEYIPFLVVAAKGDTVEMILMTNELIMEV